MARKKPESVLIVGAGIAGLCTAYHLAEAGVDDVVVIDKGKIGSGSSGKSGAVNTMLMPTETGTRARAISMDIFERFNDILDDYSFHQCGSMFIFTEEEFRANERQHAMYRRAGARFDTLRSAEVEERFPDLRIRNDEYCVLDYRGGWNEPDTYIRALSAKVRQLGADIREDEPVEEFIIESGCVSGVRAEASGELRADAVVCTVNAWANSLLSHVGQPIPARNFVHERFVTTPFPEAPQVPATNDNANQVYYRPTEDNRLLFGSGAHEPVEVVMPGIDFDYTALELAPEPGPFIKDAVKERLPMMEGVELEKHRVGLISMTPDLLPNIGPVAALPGLFLGTNFNSGGFGYHTVAGLLLTEFILEGRTRIDVTEFSPDRFANFDTKAFLEKEQSYRTIRRH